MKTLMRPKKLFVESFFALALAFGPGILISMPPAIALPPLQGRIEQLNGTDPTLPVELRATALKLLDLSPVKSKINTLQAELKSFPATLRGNWKGQLEIISCEYSDAFSTAQPADAERAKEMIREGLMADSSFRFYTPRVGFVTMAPPEIKVILVDATRKTINHIYLSAPDLDSERYSTLGDGNRVKQVLLKNDVRMLAANIAEQDLVVAVLLTDRATGKQTKTFEETVYRFTKDKPFQLSVEVAKVKYGDSGSWWSKAMLKGDVR
ncbi:hypothetical protein BH11CYA1_BH11CYA1_22380 [soil metagenome]